MDYNKQKTTFIYTLCDPDTLMVRYVGKTNNPRHRLAQHLLEKKKDNSHKARWIKKLKREGKKPILQIIEEVDMDKWEEAEIKWISFYKGLGCKLTNISEGGHSHLITNEMRDKIRKANLGKKAKEETKQKLSIATKNYMSDPKIRKKQSDACKKQWSDLEYRKKRSEDTKKLWADKKYRENVLKAQVEALEKIKADPNYKKKKSERTKILWQNPIYRKNNADGRRDNKKCL
jgi:hypothetical protein